MVTAFREIIQFLDKIGVYDIVLPFLLVFVIVFAILEKTKVLGTEKIENKEYTKKNLNSLAAFVIAFLVIASARLVEIINVVSSQMVILLMLSVLFLLLIGSFYKESEGGYLQGGWKTLFMLIMFFAILLIFLNALGWLDEVWKFVLDGEGAIVGTIILFIIVILAMWWATTSSDNKSSSKSKKED